ncbi:MAG: ABC transporter ATP-binding protein [Armatimonadetes bacterium]|nr:ABC transporter ATP-binding protein [Armatimonadota bacterium]
MLDIQDVEVYYGAIQALYAINVSVQEGEIVTLIGANGAGKSTTLRTISGLVRPRRGRVRFMDKDISGLPPHEVVRLGISQSPEGRRVFSNLSVFENLEMGAYVRSDPEGMASDLEQVFGLFPRLRERAKQGAGTLSGGEQQMLAIGRALMSRPKLLLLDEPSLGLAPFLVREIFGIITDIRSKGTTVLLVEQNARQALSIADRGYVLETGQVLISDTAEELLASEMIQKAYLGE